MIQGIKQVLSLQHEAYSYATMMMVPTANWESKAYRVEREDLLFPEVEQSFSSAEA